MSALLNLVSSFCMATPGSYNNACSKALEAGGKQSGIEKTLNTTESNVGKQARSIAEDQLGQEGTELVAGGAFIINAAATQRFIINLPTYGWCSSFRTEYRPSLYRITVEWKF